MITLRLTYHQARDLWKGKEVRKKHQGRIYYLKLFEGYITVKDWTGKYYYENMKVVDTEGFFFEDPKQVDTAEYRTYELEG
jgi:hypothetical protein